MRRSPFIPLAFFFGFILLGIAGLAFLIWLWDQDYVVVQFKLSGERSVKIMTAGFCDKANSYYVKIDVNGNNVVSPKTIFIEDCGTRPNVKLFASQDGKTIGCKVVNETSDDYCYVYNFESGEYYCQDEGAFKEPKSRTSEMQSLLINAREVKAN